MVIGLTGMSGAGKSVAAKIFAQHNWPVIDADDIARQVVLPGQAAYKEVVSVFGTGILYHDGTLNRRALGGIVFSDARELARLNAITHPPIIQQIQKLLEKYKNHAVIDAPLLYETGLHRLCHKVIVVTAPEEIRCSRIMRRDGLSKEVAMARLVAQAEQKQWIAKADYVIKNDSTEQALSATVEAILQEIMERE